VLVGISDISQYYNHLTDGYDVRQISEPNYGNLMVENSLERAGSTRKNRFEELFEETITASITDLLGESSMRAILFHLNLQRVGSDPVAFDKKLRELLSAPASIIEETIVKDLFRRLDLLYSPSGPFDFQKSVKSAKEVFAHQEKKRRE